MKETVRDWTFYMNITFELSILLTSPNYYLDLNFYIKDPVILFGTRQN